MPAPFIFGCSLAVFPPDELKALSEEGSRLEALAAGQVLPVSSADEHFLLVNREETEPETVLERAWSRLKARREFERDEREQTPPSPPPSYDIIEFDADRCWW
jgi:uncharacterized protein YifE (UPF0438 family)